MFEAKGKFIPLDFQVCFPSLEGGVNMALAQPFSLAKIINVMFHMGAFKAQGEDSLQLVFYQSQWAKVGQSMFQLINMFLNSSKIK